MIRVVVVTDGVIPGGSAYIPYEELDWDLLLMVIVYGAMTAGGGKRNLIVLESMYSAAE
jgi:hypothetical protein